MKTISIQYNPVLAKIFRAVKLAENAGFDKMIDGWKLYKGSKPEFYTDITSTIFTFYLTGNEVPDNVPDKVPDKLLSDLSKNQIKIIELIKNNNRISMQEMAKEVGISKRKILDNINKLKDKNMIKRIGNAKSGHWEIL